MDLLKTRFSAADANFIDESRLLCIKGGSLKLRDWIKPAPGEPAKSVTFELGDFGAEVGPGWVVLRNYELDRTQNFRANAKSGIVGIFDKERKSRFNPFKSRNKCLVIQVAALLKDLETSDGRTVKWEDWKECVTVLDLPKDYELYVFHTHVLCLHPSNSPRYYIFDFAPHTAGLMSSGAARGDLPDWVKSLTKPWTPPVTFSGKIKGLEGKYFPTENGILAIKVSPIFHGNRSY